MGNSTYRGIVSPLQQWFERSYDPSSGYTYRTEFRGLDYYQAEALSNYYSSLGITAVLRYQYGVSTLTLTDPTGNVLIDKWELGVDEERPSMFENPKLVALLKNSDNPTGAYKVLQTVFQAGDPVGDAWENLIAGPQAKKDPIPGTGTSDNPQFPGTPQTFGGLLNQQIHSINAAFPPSDHYPLGSTFLANSTWMAALKQYFDDYNKGVTNFIRGKYRLRHTTNAPARWNANIADFNVEMIYSISQLLSETQSTALWALPLPGYLVYKILTYAVPDLTSTPQYFWGALKLRSSACTAANNRVEIATEYLIDAVNTNLYGVI